MIRRCFAAGKVKGKKITFDAALNEYNSYIKSFLTSTKRNKSLDFLRGAAVLLVMAGHYFNGYFSNHIGWSGVDLFFVLSGFFVSGILFREFNSTGKIRAKRFLIRRGLNILAAVLYRFYYTMGLLYL